jgi:hypothetical protein
MNERCMCVDDPAPDDPAICVYICPDDARYIIHHPSEWPHIGVRFCRRHLLRALLGHDTGHTPRIFAFTTRPIVIHPLGDN